MVFIRMISSLVIYSNNSNIHSFAEYHIHLNVGECEIMTTLSFDLAYAMNVLPLRAIDLYRPLFSHQLC